MITLSDVGMRFGSQVLFEHITWQLQPGQHTGLVGANGTGKSTLLKLMAGELSPESGSISRPNALRLGLLGQDQSRYDAFALLDVVLMGRPALWRAVEEKERLQAEQLQHQSGPAQPGNGGAPRAETQSKEHEDLAGHRLAELEAQISDLGGYQAEAQAAQLLEGLGLPQARHRRPMSELSGGYRLRVLLAQTLFSDPELLLLDEPTNHLDLISIRWLEGYLQAFAGTLVIVSHDRHFLNAVSEQIADIDYGELRLYPGDYERFVAAKALAQAQKETEIARLEEKIAVTERFIERFRAKATKARQAQSRKKQIEKIELPEIKRSSRRAPSFTFTPRRPSGKEALAVERVSKAYGGRPVLEGVNFSIERGEKVAVIGPNGIGKSTLLKIIAGALAPDAGQVRLGYEAHLGYFAQDFHDVLKGRVTVYDWLAEQAPGEEVGTLRGILGRALFSGDEVKKRLDALSGGEAARLLIAHLMLRRDNLLVLDEPTNHLDLEGREALMSALGAFTGTLIFVSHDRHFVSAVAGRILAFSPAGMEDFVGTYEQYLQRQGADYLTLAGSPSGRRPLAADGRQYNSQRAGGMSPSTAPSAAAGAITAAGAGFADQKTRKRDAARLRKTVEKLEGRIAALEQTLADLDRQGADPEYARSTPWQELQQRRREREDAHLALQSTLKEWEAAAQALESSQGAG